MKKRILILFLAVFSVTSVLMVSCKKEQAVTAQLPLENRLANDPVFKNTILAATDLGMSLNIESLSSDQNIEELKSIAARINNKTATAADYDKVKTITGVSYEDFIAKLRHFGETLAALNKAHPELEKMKEGEMSSLFTKAINANPSIKSLVANPAGISSRIAGKCPLQDICKLAVALAKIFGGDALCALIGTSTIPIIGGLLCQLILSLGVAILNGICGALPC